MAWQPGLAMRLVRRSASRWPGASSGSRTPSPDACGAPCWRRSRRSFGLRHQRHRLARRGVGQAQERDVSGVEQPRALGVVLALSGSMRSTSTSSRSRELLVDLQPGGAFLAVDENLDASSRPRPQPRHEAVAQGYRQSGSGSKVAAAAACPTIGDDGHEKTKGTGHGTRGAARAQGGRRRRRPAAKPRHHACACDSCSPAATSRARAWTKARCTNWRESIKSQGVMQPILVRPLAGRMAPLRNHRRRASLARRQAGRPRRSAGARAGRARRVRGRDVADREHPARGPEPA